jgi:hypothetical protein
MSAGPERMFSGTFTPERIRLGVTMVERTECLKSWISIIRGRQQALLSGVLNSRFVDEAINLLQKDLDDVGRD